MALWHDGTISSKKATSPCLIISMAWIEGLRHLSKKWRKFRHVCLNPEPEFPLRKSSKKPAPGEFNPGAFSLSSAENFGIGFKHSRLQTKKERSTRSRFRKMRVEISQS
jgi:hypothetical protein